MCCQALPANVPLSNVAELDHTDPEGRVDKWETVNVSSERGMHLGFCKNVYETLQK